MSALSVARILKFLSSPVVIGLFIAGNAIRNTDQKGRDTENLLYLLF